MRILILFVFALSSLCQENQARTLPSEIDFSTYYEISRDYERVKRQFEAFGSFAALLAFGQDFGKDVEVTCTACQAAGDSVRFFLDEGRTEQELLAFLHSICLNLQIMTPSVCDGFVTNVGPEIIYIVNTTTLSSLQICWFLVGDACGDVSNPGNEWTVPLPPIQKPPISSPEPPPSDGERSKILHISDTHIDIFYQEGTRVDCDEPLCCRNQSGWPSNGERSAGYWGDWKCDTPIRTLDSMLQSAAETHPDVKMIYWTGDLPSHDLWDQTKNSTLSIIAVTVEKIKTAFPNVPVFPAIGNHDSSPVNSFPHPEVEGQWDISWLYDELVEQWGVSSWSENSTGTVRKGAFYSTSPNKGFRIISLNMNYCYLNNWWLIINSTDPAQELAWFAEELQKAEERGEKVHILGHIPPGHRDCLPTWSREYLKIVSRYESTIVAQFFGHTHKDEFEVYYDPENNTRPIATSFIGPSVTTYTNLNPGYRIYYMDNSEDSSHLIVDHETWYLDLQKANNATTDSPVWEKSYSFLEEYRKFGINNLLPEDGDKLYKQLQTNSEAFDLYYKHMTKESPVRGRCDENCKSGILCAIKSCMLYPQSDNFIN